MFGFFKRKKAEKQLLDNMGERILNESIFTHHFSTIFDSETFNSTKVPLAEKIWILSTSLAYTVSEKAKNSEDPLNESDSNERAASVVIFAQTVESISDFIMFTDKKKLLDIYSNGMSKLLCKEFDKPTPSENADMAFSVAVRNLLIKEHLYILQGINDNCCVFQ